VASEDYETWARERRDCHPELPEVSEPVFQIMLEGRRAMLQRANALLSDDPYEWDRRLSRQERERFAKSILRDMGLLSEEPEVPGDSTGESAEPAEGPKPKKKRGGRNDDVV
jgi:hypothetical protein